jgi:L,D-peptidoglycan transpeptidase YkuD (ErfK/YbiS/YcfS/YnhG family)
MHRAVKSLHFRALSRKSTRGLLIVGGMRFPAACGRSGRAAIKREGDGLTPLGSYALEALLYRADRLLRPRAGLSAMALRENWAWCETPGDRNYNRLVALPPAAGHDRLKRADHLYDVIVVTGHNRRPRIQNRGSAIFFHLARDGFAPTAGCIAVSLKAMREILARCGPSTRLVVH